MKPIINPALTIIQDREDGFAARYNNLLFIVSISTELDNKNWLHASVSRDDKKLPTYNDLMIMKHLCIGDHRTALQVFPPKDKHINIAGKLGTEVLHLWSCLTSDVTPDFTRGGNSI